jgi:hypothetical protein
MQASAYTGEDVLPEDEPAPRPAEVEMRRAVRGVD